MNLYTSDLHLGHANVILHDHRPFADVDEMDSTLIKLWNDRVSKNDDVYVVGDLIFRSGKTPEWYLRQLKGRKHLIIGNHDTVILKSEQARSYFESIDQIKTIHDNGKTVVLCHYPLAEWDGYFRDAWHVYGHIHNNTNDAYQFMKAKERALNAASCINNYTPASLNELVRNNDAFKQDH